MVELMDEPLTWGTAHEVKGCKAKQHTGTNDSSEYSSQNLYCFDLRECQKTTGPGVTASMIHLNKCRNTVAKELTVGDWVLFDASDDEVEPLWLGRVMSNAEWEGQGVEHNNTSRMRTYGDVKVGKGEVGVFVMWYEKINVMDDKLEYWVSRTETKPIVQNNKYHIPITFELHWMLGEKNVVPKLRSSTRSETKRSSMNNARRIDDWHDKEFDVVWKMDEDLMRTALSLSNN